MTVSARHEFRIWAASIFVFFILTVLVVSFTVTEGGWWAFIPVLWVAAGLGCAAWVKKVRQDAVDAV